MANDFINLPQSIDLNISPVQPQTTIYLAKGIPWDNKYVHVRPFASKSELLAYVQSMTPSGYTITQSAPVRTGRLSVSVKANEAVAMKFNYMAFQNLPYDSEWHFAFITNVIWKSNSSVTIEFELDVFQECWYSANLKPCFIERAHIAKSADTVGANVVPDNIETGELTCYKHDFLSFLNSTYKIGMYTSDLPGGTPEPGTTNHAYNGMFNGLYSFSWNFNGSDTTDIENAIKEYNDVGKADAIQLIFQYPDLCDVKPGASVNTKSYTGSYTFSHYTPKNNKLYTYPYSYMVCDDNSGNTNVFRNELWNNGINIKMNGIKATTPSVYSVPMGYNGVSQNDEYGFITSNFPLCAWTTDTFKAWLAQNKNSMALGNMTAAFQGLGGLVAGIGGAMTGNPLAIGAGINSVISGGLQIANTVATTLDKKQIPDSAKGKVNSECTRTAMQLDRLDFYYMCPQDNMLRVIDDYWSAFGYPIHEIQTPTWNNRSSWNYLKTIDCGFTADAELELLQKFRAIFDNGVTLWHTNDVGNYELSNN